MSFFSKTSLLRLAMFLTVFSLDAAPMEREEEASFSLKPMEETLRHILSGTPAEKTPALSSALAMTQNPRGSLTDRDAAAHLVISYGSPEQQTAVVPLYLAKALDPACPPGERLVSAQLTITHGTPEQRTAVAPFFLGRALNLQMTPEAARNTTNYGTPAQKMEILMTAMSDAGLHQNLLYRKEAPEAPLSAELQTYLRTQAPEVWPQQNPYDVQAMYEMIFRCAEQPPHQWEATLARYKPKKKDPGLGEDFME